MILISELTLIARYINHHYNYQITFSFPLYHFNKLFKIFEELYKIKIDFVFQVILSFKIIVKWDLSECVFISDIEVSTIGLAMGHVTVGSQ